MESLPDEVKWDIYSRLDPEDYRNLSRVSQDMRRISEDEQLLKPIIVKGKFGKVNWITKTNRKGECFNSITISELRELKDSDIVEGYFIYEYRGFWNFSVTCPIDSDGYLSGELLIIALPGLGNYETNVRRRIDMVNGKINGKSGDRVHYVDGVTLENFGIRMLESRNRDLIIGYDPDLKIRALTGFGKDFNSFRKGRSFMSALGYNPILGYLPKSLTSEDIPIYEDNIYDLILPLALYDCSSIEEIQRNVELLINRYHFYISPNIVM